MNDKGKKNIFGKNFPDKIESLREKIDELDSGGITYLKERFEIAKEIAETKKDAKSCVYDPDREQAVIRKAQKNFPLQMNHRIESVMGTIMRVSRENQYDILADNDEEFDLKKLIQGAPGKIKTPKNVVCQGSEGSYSHIAASCVFPDSRRVPARTFDECIEKIQNGEYDLAVLPLENTTAGTVNDVCDLISDKSVYIVKAVSIPINHRLVLLPEGNISDVKTVLSHPQALAQCSGYIKRMGWNVLPVENTAFAARELAELNNPSYCAIASGQAGSINKLKILDDKICDFDHNQTRFVVLSGSFIIEDKANRLSLSFRLMHQSGSLASVLNVFAERGLNMTKIQSRPVADTPWEYSFWVDISAKKHDKNVLLALYQLSKELPRLNLLGWYEESCADGF